MACNLPLFELFAVNYVRQSAFSFSPPSPSKRILVPPSSFAFDEDVRESRNEALRLLVGSRQRALTQADGSCMWCNTPAWHLPLPHVCMHVLADSSRNCAQLQLRRFMEAYLPLAFNVYPCVQLVHYKSTKTTSVE